MMSSKYARYLRPYEIPETGQEESEWMQCYKEKLRTGSNAQSHQAYIRWRKAEKSLWLLRFRMRKIPELRCQWCRFVIDLLCNLPASCCAQPGFFPDTQYLFESRIPPIPIHRCCVFSVVCGTEGQIICR